MYNFNGSKANWADWSLNFTFKHDFTLFTNLLKFKILIFTLYSLVNTKVIIHQLNIFINFFYLNIKKNIHYRYKISVYSLAIHFSLNLYFYAFFIFVAYLFLLSSISLKMEHIIFFLIAENTPISNPIHHPLLSFNFLSCTSYYCNFLSFSFP